eukprot:765711-Prorocentrum_lima.AAC.1
MQTQNEFSPKHDASLKQRSAAGATWASAAGGASAGAAWASAATHLHHGCSSPSPPWPCLE